MNLQNVELTYDRYRKQVEHEDILINHRTTWLVTTQSFFMAAFTVLYYNYYVISSSKNVNVFLFKLKILQIKPQLPETNLSTYKIMLLSIPIVGMLISWAAICSINSANRAIQNLKIRWDAYINNNKSLLLEIPKKMPQTIDEIKIYHEVKEQIDRIDLLSHLTDGAQKPRRMLIALFLPGSAIVMSVPGIFFALWFAIFIGVAVQTGIIVDIGFHLNVYMTSPHVQTRS